MLQLRRPAGRTLQRISRTQQRRRVSHDEVAGRQDTSTGHFDSAGQQTPVSHGHHPEPVNESLGRGFYFTLAALPLSIALYKFSRSSDDGKDPSSQPWLTRVIGSYDHWRDDWTRRNTLHTAMIEQAAHDRHLFHGSPGSKVIELRFPEVFNTGSPFNVPAGSQANLDELMEHYRRKNTEAQEKREAKAQAIYEGRESERSRFKDGTKVIPGSATY